MPIPILGRWNGGPNKWGLYLVFLGSIFHRILTYTDHAFLFTGSDIKFRDNMELWSGFPYQALFAEVFVSKTGWRAGPFLSGLEFSVSGSRSVGLCTATRAALKNILFCTYRDSDSTRARTDFAWKQGVERKWFFLFYISKRGSIVSLFASVSKFKW